MSERMTTLTQEPRQEIFLLCRRLSDDLYLHANFAILCIFEKRGFLSIQGDGNVDDDPREANI